MASRDGRHPFHFYRTRAVTASPVERAFQLYSPLIASIEVKRRGDVRRAKLYYLRDRSGKSARIREKLSHKSAAEKAAADESAE